ncbi:MAG TPA: arylesterase [Casimicrobiaceae bacterium]|jgi:acyl-CoA thioesterase-1|nr:arylesterase [Casimicrobiaceae bacterium]
MASRYSLHCAPHWIMALAIALFCASAVAAPAPIILIVGDSISAGYGLPQNSGWVALLQQRLANEHYPHRVVNASISGDTTAGGRDRLGALLEQHRPAVTVVELGGNDGLRGGSLEAMRANLDAMVAMAQKAGSRVLLVGMQMPPNYGAAYVNQFSATFAAVAAARHTALVPFLFEGFATDDAMFQGDRIHPALAVQPQLLENVWRGLKPLLGAPGKA